MQQGVRGLILGSTKLHRWVQLRPGGNEPHHRRFVLRTDGDALQYYHQWFVLRTGGDEPAVMHLITVGSNSRYDYQLWNRR